MTYQTLHNNPFPGIRSYEPEEDELFFGRERRIKELIEKLTETRFLAIVGSSGCGKSSLIKAGLIPTLVKHKVKQSPDNWKLIITRPGSDPIGKLVEAIFETFNRFEPASVINRIKHRLLFEPEFLPDIINEIAGNDSYSYLLVIDQFEELFRFRQSSAAQDTHAEASRFVELFLHASTQKEMKISVVLSMRTDFIDDCTEFTHLNESINKGYYLVPRMNEDEKRLAITGPLTVKGSKISEELIQRLLTDVGDDPDQLPIMQHALMRTFEYWSTYKIGDEPLDISHYEAIGTMKEALSVHCEEIFTELKQPHYQLIAEKIFKALTDFSTDSRGTRRPVKLSSLCVLAEAKQEEVTKVIDHFRESGRAFLRPSFHVEIQGDSTIDISHESIMRVWKRLRKWVDEERNSAQLYLRLSKSAELYQLGKSGIWINPELQLALQWRDTNKPNATWAMRYDVAFDRAMEFLTYSQKQYLLEISRKEDQQKRNLKQARSFAIILGAATLISILFLVVSLNLRFKAEASRKDALEKQKLAMLESKKAEEQRQQAILQKRISEQQQQIAEQQKLITEDQRQYAVSQQGIAEEKTKEAIQQKIKADKSRQEAIRARDETEVQRKEAVSQKQIADKERLKAENSEKNTQRLRLLSISRSLSVQASQLSLTVKDELPGLLASQAYLFNKDNGGPDNDPDLYQALSAVVGDQTVLRGHEDAVRAFVLSEDGHSLISCGDDGKVLVWDLNNTASRPIALNTGNYGKEGIRSIALSKDWIMAGCFNGKLLAWDRKQLKSQALVIQAHNGVVNALVYDGATNQFCSGGSDGKVLLWKWNANTFKPTTLDAVNANILSLTFDAKQNFYALGCSNGMLKVIYPANPSQNTTLLSSGSSILAVAFSPDGQILAAGDDKGSLRIWDVKGLAVLKNEMIGRHSSGILALGFSPDGKYIATAGFDRLIRCSSLEADVPDEYSISKHDLWIYGVMFSKDDKKIISCSADKTIGIYTAGCEQLALQAEKSLKRNLSREEWNQYIGPDIPYQKTIKRLP